MSTQCAVPRKYLLLIRALANRAAVRFTLLLIHLRLRAVSHGLHCETVTLSAILCLRVLLEKMAHGADVHEFFYSLLSTSHLDPGLNLIVEARVRDTFLLTLRW